MKPLPKVACIWLPNWPIQRLAAAQTGLRRRVVVLYEARANSLRVAACSREAMARGVQSEMPLAEALALVEGDRYSQGQNQQSTIPVRQEPILVEPHDPIADRQALEELALLCQQFSPIVALEESPRPQCLLLDLTGVSHLFGGEAALLQRIEQAFIDRRLAIHLAVAETVGAAWALAHDRSRSKAGDSSRDSNLQPPASSLAGLHVAALRLSLDTVVCLEELGIQTIGQVQQLPRETLLSRFGPELLRRLDQATGLLPEAIVAHKSPAEYQAEWLLEHPTDRRETIDFVLETLVTRLTQQLAARREGVLRLEVRLSLQSREPWQFSLGLYRASAAPKHLLGLLQLQLENVRLRAPVTAIRLTAVATGPLSMEQQGLFAEDQDRAAPRHLAALVDRLSSRLGRNAVVQPRLLADAQPEHACQYVPLAGHKAATVRRVSPTGSRGVSFPLCPLQLTDPQALPVMSVVPEGPPIRFCVAGVEHRVLNFWGPERIETGWWRKRGIRRDYYRVETETGQRFWLYRRLSDERWFCQGAFE